ncbi:DMT family transporter [Pyrococcus yayanosii]|uniref:Permease n=1 Tax=Pyrococcus yayanosii (strain CH1 / JCM 16557) TaxID=529709 RepID=F8AF68_PYRYC|nr:DMT family transporter [Pyrococcus yayanosii]AEH24896.1 permease [Pyrococcus yayanosii CH1]
MILGILLALISAFAWGISSVLIKVGLRKKSPVSANLVRLYVAALTYLIIFYLNGSYGEIASLPFCNHVIAFISAQFGFVIGDYFYFSALKRLGVSRVVPITSTYPLWTILWVHLFLGRTITLNVVVGAILIVAALWIVRKAEVEEHADPKGFLYALLTPISWSLAITLMDWLSNRMSPLTLAGLRMIYAALGLTLVSWRYIDEIKGFSKRELSVVGPAGLLGLVIAQYTFVKSVALVGSQIATPVTAINPIVSTTLAVGFLGEPPNKKILIGLILVVIGIVLITS